MPLNDLRKIASRSTELTQELPDKEDDDESLGSLDPETHVEDEDNENESTFSQDDAPLPSNEYFVRPSGKEKPHSRPWKLNATEMNKMTGVKNLESWWLESEKKAAELPTKSICSAYKIILKNRDSPLSPIDIMSELVLCDVGQVRITYLHLILFVLSFSLVFLLLGRCAVGEGNKLPTRPLEEQANSA